MLRRAGGSSVRTFLEKQGSFQKQEALQLRLCGLGNPTMLNAYFCYTQVGKAAAGSTVMPEAFPYNSIHLLRACPQKAPRNEARNASCSEQQSFLDGAARERSFYEAASCNLATGHYDFRCAGSQRGPRRTVGTRRRVAGRQGSEAAQIPSVLVLTGWRWGPATQTHASQPPPPQSHRHAPQKRDRPPADRGQPADPAGAHHLVLLLPEEA